MNIQELTDQIIELLQSGPLLPGGVTTQFGSCGKAGCRCRDPENPRKHGPYGKLSFSLLGADSSMHVRSADLADVRRMVARFEALGRLCGELALAYVELVRREGVGAAAGAVPLSEDRRRVQRLSEANAQLRHGIEAARSKCANWKAKAEERTKAIALYRTAVRDLRISRENWKAKAKQARTTVRTLEDRLARANGAASRGGEKGGSRN